MAKTNKSISITDEVYEKLYDYILNGDIKPGENIKISSLKDKFSVSLAVIREALIRLTAQGIVIQKPNCGFMVVELNHERVEQVIDTRKINEGSAIRLAIRNGDMSWESNVIAKEYELEHTNIYLDEEKQIINPEWNDKHYEFHYSIIKGCNNHTLLHICNYLWNISRVYRKECLLIKDNYRIFENEHKKLMEAVINRKEDEAVRLFEEHMDRTKEQMLSIIKY